MKHLLLFSLGLAAGFLLGNRRARKTGPIDQLCIEIKADTAQAVTALRELSKEARRAAMHVETALVHTVELKAKGADLVGVIQVEIARQGRVVTSK